jgi:plasmid stabilization system protein ParE
MRIRYTLRARADIEEINEYLQKQAPAAAQEAVATIRRRIELLGEFPYMAPATDEPGVRQLTLTRHPLSHLLPN